MTTLNFRARVSVFDANIGVGHRHDQPSPFNNAAELCAEMHRHGVERGLIYSLQGETLSAIDGTAPLPRRQHDAPVPQWVTGPGAAAVGGCRRASGKRELPRWPPAALVGSRRESWVL